MKTKLLFLSLFLLITSFSKAQDTLQLVRNSEILIVKVTEIGIDEIKYTPWGIDDAPTIVVEKSSVKKIILSNGSVININEDPLSLSTMSEETLAKTRVLKFQFFSPLMNCLAFGYETSLKKGTNLETKVGFIGLGFQENRPKAAGAYFKIGPKFFKGKDTYVRGERRSHPMRGAYIKPEVSYSHFWQEMQTSYNGLAYTTTRVTYNCAAINIVFGNQYLLGDIMTLDWYFGMGYGFQSSNFNDTKNNSIYQDTDPGYLGYVYSHVYLGKTFPLTMTGGLTLGVLFK